MVERNWSGTYTYRARTIHRPGTLAELQQLIGSSSATLHPLGTRHSFNSIADGDELVSLADFDAGSVEVDREAMTVRVPAATRYGDLAVQLHAHGLALPNLASLPHISVGGSVATATHGSGVANRALSSAVRSVSLVTGSGDVVGIEAGDERFAGAVVSLGALGVVTDLVLAVEPAVELRQDVYVDLPWDQLLGSFDDVMGCGYSVSAFTDYTGDVVPQLWVKTRLDGAGDAGVPAERFGARAATQQVHPAPGEDPRNCTPQLGVPGPWYDRLPHFLLEFTPSSGSEIQSEWLLDRSRAAQALTAMRGLGTRIAPFMFVSEIRTVAADEAWISPFQGRDTVAVHITWKPDLERVPALIAAVADVLAPLGARPHWAKVCGQGYDFAELYPQLPRFAALRDELDPHGRFRTAAIDTIVG